MKGRIHFRYDPDEDIVVATPEWRIKTEQDCDDWRRHWEGFLEPFGRKMDCIMVLDKFHVAAGIADAWGLRRAEINKKYIRFSYRVKAEMHVQTFTLTSGIRYDAASDQAASVEAAIERIRDARKKAAV